jgi:uncharacterized membrane protein YidH (DUF202 family)
MDNNPFNSNANGTGSKTGISIDKSSIFGQNADKAPTTFGPEQIAGLLNTVYLVAGMIAVIAIIIGAIRFMSANGESSKVSSAKNVISYAVVGLVVIMVAAAATNWVISSVGTPK